ncbi:hypothetical protein AQUCO_01900015v1, partial [Aquilegia coerulea]
QLPLTFTLVIFLFIVVKQFRSGVLNKKAINIPPGPWKLPVIGHLHHLLGHLPHHTLKDLAKKHGPLMFLQLGEVSSITASTPRVAKEILKVNDLIFADRATQFSGKITTYGGIGLILSPYGGHWRQLRKICILELLSAKKVQSFLSIRDEEVANLVETISSTVGSPVNLTQKIFSLTNEITCRAAFGEKCKEKETFMTLMKELVKLFNGFEIVDLFPSFKFLHMITDLIDVLLRLEEDNELEFPIENNCIKALILEIFIAGSDTSSVVLEWAFSEIVKHPRIMEKAQSEVRQVLHGKTKVGQSDINELKYLKLIIKETLRLHPPAPLLTPRESRERCEINGYEIPKGTKVIVNAWALGRDAENFKPERFEGRSVDYKGTNYEYIPFGAGKRICPGMSFGVANIELPLAQLLYHFDWKLPNGVKSEDLEMTEIYRGTVGRKYNLYLTPTLYFP